MNQAREEVLPLLRRTLAVVLCGVFATPASVFAQDSNQSPTIPYEAVGTILPRGAVSLNGATALPHTTLYAGDTLHTPPGSLAMLATLDGSKIQVFGGSDLAITRGLQGFELGLRRGAVEVRSPGDRGIAVVAEDVRARSHGQTPAAFLFDHRGEDIRVTTYRGAVEVSGPALRDGPTIVPAGQTAWLWLTTQGPQIQPQPPYPAGAGAERAKKRERRVLYLLLAGGAAAGTVAAIILATESDPRP